MADSTFTPPLLQRARPFGSLTQADSLFGSALLQRARPFAAPVVADSQPAGAAWVAYALAANPEADSSGSGAANVAFALNAAPQADSGLGPALLNSTDGLLTFVIADSQSLADMIVGVPLAASLVSDSALASAAPDIYRLPPPNRPQPLPPPAVVPLRIVPNPAQEPQMSVGSPPAPTRRQGL